MTIRKTASVPQVFRYRIEEYLFSLSHLTYGKIFSLLDLAEEAGITPDMSFSHMLGRLSAKEKIYPLLALLLEEEVQGDETPLSEQEVIVFLQENLTIAGFEEIMADLLRLHPGCIQQVPENHNEVFFASESRKENFSLLRQQFEEEVFLLTRGDILKRPAILSTLTPHDAKTTLLYLEEEQRKPALSHHLKREVPLSQEEEEQLWQQSAIKAFQQFQEGEGE